jgi:hypothetical protein
MVTAINTRVERNSSSAHSFFTTLNKNGNITITFYEGTKQRHIKFIKNTSACSDYINLRELMVNSDHNYSEETLTFKAITALRSKYLFKKHPNNASIFYPHSK